MYTVTISPVWERKNSIHMPTFHASRLRNITDGRSWIAKARLAGIVALFITIGVLTIIATKAATSDAMGELESGDIAGNAKIVTAPTGYSGTGAVLFGAGPTVQPLPFKSVTGTIVAGGSCLDVENGQASSSASIRLWDCNGADAQKWTLGLTPNGSVEVKALGMCLGAADNQGSPVYLQLQACSSSTKTAQQWLPMQDNSGRILNVGFTASNNRDICLDYISLTNSTDLPAIATYCDSTAVSQKHTLPANSPKGTRGHATFSSNTAKCLDVPSGTTTPGTQLQVWDCNNLAPQTLVVGHENAGSERMRISILGQCLEAKDGGSADGTPVQINTCNDSPAQDWKTTVASNGAVLKSYVSDKCLDTASGTVANSTLMVLKTCNNGPGQIFK